MFEEVSLPNRRIFCQQLSICKNPMFSFLTVIFLKNNSKLYPALYFKALNKTAIFSETRFEMVDRQDQNTIKKREPEFLSSSVSSALQLELVLGPLVAVKVLEWFPIHPNRGSAVEGFSSACLLLFPLVMNLYMRLSLLLKLFLNLSSSVKKVKPPIHEL